MAKIGDQTERNGRERKEDREETEESKAVQIDADQNGTKQNETRKREATQTASDWKDRTIKEKFSQLEKYFQKIALKDVCLAFSGGVDSSLLLRVAVNEAARTGKKVYAVTFDSRLHPSCDLEIARQVVREIGGIHQIIRIDELEQEEIRTNPQDRCYQCKRLLFERLKSFADTKGISVILDGTNEDDLHVYRPGIRALRELGILSPLAELHITKDQVKEMAAFYGISVAARPSTPCMATRIPYGQKLDYEILAKIAEGEAHLRSKIGGNIRLRLHGNIIRLEVDCEEFIQVLKMREEIVGYMRNLGFDYVTLDLEGFRSGSMDLHIVS